MSHSSSALRVFHLEAPVIEPLIQPLAVAGWVASDRPIRAIRGAGDDHWLDLEPRPDVRAAHPHFLHVAGFRGMLSLASVFGSTLRFECVDASSSWAHSVALAPRALPPESLQVRQVGGVWGKDFYRSGQNIFDQFAAAFAAAGKPLQTASRILDFGCGCGRVLWMFEHLPHTGEVWGCDVDAEAVAWNSAHLPGIAKFLANDALPPTRFAPGYFDAIYSMSVFTHLPEDVQFQWLYELQRITSPGGVVVASVHGQRYWSVDRTVKADVERSGFAYRTGAATPGLPSYYMAAFHSEAYVREHWSRYFEILDYNRDYLHSVHDAVVMRRR